jgi:hypothetical protein
VVRGCDGLALGPPDAASAGEAADRLLLLRVDAHHRQALGQELFDGGVDVPELRVTVGDLGSSPGLGHALQAEPHLMQQSADQRSTGRVPGRRQFASQVSQRRGGPAQRGDRISDLPRLNQQLQRRDQAGVTLSGGLAPASGPAHPSKGGRPFGQLGAAPGDGRLRHFGQPGNRLGPAMPQRLGLGGQIQAALPLVEVRQERRELHIQDRQDPFRYGHNNPYTTSDDSEGP